MSDKYPYVFGVPQPVLELYVKNIIERPDPYNPRKSMNEIEEELSRGESAINEGIENMAHAAFAQLRTLDALMGLGEEFVIVNNVDIELKKSYRDKNWNWEVYSAEVDHVVLGRTSVFTVDTTNLDKAPVASSRGLGPVQQAQFNGKVVWHFLSKENGFARQFKTYCSSCGSFTPHNLSDGSPQVTVKPVDKIRDVIYWSATSQEERLDSPQLASEQREIVRRLSEYRKEDWWRPGDEGEPPEL